MCRLSKWAAALPAFLFLLVGSSGLRAATEAAPDADAAIRAIWAELDARWNGRDAIGFSELFTDDVSFEFVDRGESLEGRTVVREYFSQRFPRFAPGLRHRTTVRDIAIIASNVAAVDGTVEILRETPDMDSALLRTFAIFAVMTRDTEVWTIRMLRVYELQETVAAAAGSQATRS